MANVLEKIVADKRQELLAKKQSLPLEHFIGDLTPSDRSFFDALNQNNAGYVFECKKASPSKGLIRENFDLDEIIDAYAPYAACISVLTDEKYFQGKFEYLTYVRERLSQPVLNKDFFIDPYQIYLARYHNADAVLLMLSVLTDEEYRQLADLAFHYNLDVLTEVSNDEEARRAMALEAKIIGINNRNLRDLSTDLATTERLVPLLRNSQHECVIISESGIYTHQDILRLSPLVNGFLVGSSVMAEPDVKSAVQQLLFGKVKICGVTQTSDANIVSQSGASFAGLIMTPKSPRYVSLDDAISIVSEVPFKYVGVFVNQEIEYIVTCAHELTLHAVQLHGQEEQSFIDELRKQLPDTCEIWKAIGIDASQTDLEIDFPTFDTIDRLLFDCKVGADFGGTGLTFDWQLLSKINAKQPIILAGGLTPENIKRAALTGAELLDVNSGVETSPGIKDEDKITEVFRQLREYGIKTRSGT